MVFSPLFLLENSSSADTIKAHVARLCWMTSHPRSATNLATQPAISGEIPSMDQIPSCDI